MPLRQQHLPAEVAAGVGQRRAGQVAARGHPGPAPRPHRPVELEQALHAVAVAGIGLEQLGAGVVVERLAGQRPGDVLRDVVVAEAHGVGVAERALGHLGRGPDPHARAGPAAAGGPLREAGRPPAPAGRRARPPALPPPTAPRRHWPAATPRTGWTPRPCASGATQSPRSAPGPGAGWPNRRTSTRCPEKASWPVTFCSMIAGHQRVQDQTRPRDVPPGIRPAGPWPPAGGGPRSRRRRRRRRAGTAPGRAPSAAPGPHALATTSPSAARGRAAGSPGPSGVGRPSHQPCPRSGWKVGSPPPRRKTREDRAHRHAAARAARPAPARAGLSPVSGRAGTCGQSDPLHRRGGRPAPVDCARTAYPRLRGTREQQEGEPGPQGATGRGPEGSRRPRRRRSSSASSSPSLVLLAGLIGVVVAYRDQRREVQEAAQPRRRAPRPPRATPVTTDTGGGQGEHVGPGTPKPDETTVKYDTVPPSHGAHFAAPAVSEPQVLHRRGPPAARDPRAQPRARLHDPLVRRHKAKGKSSCSATSPTRPTSSPSRSDKFLVVEWDS